MTFHPERPLRPLNSPVPAISERITAIPPLTREDPSEVELHTEPVINTELTRTEDPRTHLGTAALTIMNQGERPQGDRPPEGVGGTESDPPTKPEKTTGGGENPPPPKPPRPVPSPGPEEEPPRSTRLPLPPLRYIRSRDLSRAEEETKTIRREEAQYNQNRARYWRVEDSPLTGQENSFEDWFREVLPVDIPLQDYIEQTLEPVSPRLGLELGGTGSRLFSDFTPGFFESSRGINLTDTRFNSPDWPEKLERDGESHHSVIEGNILDPDTIQKVDQWLDGRKAAFIIERLFAGKETLPHDPFVLAQNAAAWYERLAEGGLFFAQLPFTLNAYIRQWADLVQETAPQLDVQIGNHYEYGLIRIHKRIGSPAQLPLIPARTLMEERNQSRNLRNWG